jgi:hypothetical protein
MLNEFIKRDTQQQILVPTANRHHIRRGKKNLPDRLYVRSSLLSPMHSH